MGKRRYIGPWDRAYIDYCIEQKVYKEMAQRTATKEPYSLYITVTVKKEVYMGVNPAYNEPITEDKIVPVQIYHNWYNTLEEAVAKFVEKKDMYIKDILKTGNYECWPAYKVSIQIKKGENIFKSEDYTITED